MRTKKKYALIDMDGTLYDSMPYHNRAWREMMAENGVATKPDEFFLYEGMTGYDTINLIFNRELGRSTTREEARRLYDRKAEIFVSYGEKGLIKDADKMIGMLIDKGIGRVLVTGSAQQSLLSRLEHDFPGGFSRDKMVTAHDVEHGKPDPEPYLKGLEKAGVGADEAFVIENAPLGVRAGKRAGIFTVALMTGPIPREEFEREGADLIFTSMTEFTEALPDLIENGF